MAKWLVSFSTTGHGTAEVEADDEDAAKEAFHEGLADDKTLELIEWEVDEVEDVEPL